MSLSSYQLLGIPWEAFELLDPDIREALLERRIEPEELHELAGWRDEDAGDFRSEGGYGRP